MQGAEGRKLNFVKTGMENIHHKLSIINQEVHNITFRTVQ